MKEKSPQIVITDTNLEEFKKLVRRAVFLKHDEDKVFAAIPNHTWRTIFAKNFDGNFEYARRSLLYKYKDIEKIDTTNVDREKNKIANLDRATKFVTDAIDKKEKVLFVTDFDNDGSLAQAVINEYLVIDKADSENMFVEYAQTVNGNSNRGFTVDHIDLIVDSKGIDPSSAFLIVTADNGINSKEEQEKILSKYPAAKIVVTDHHNPDVEMVVKENDRTVIFNPKNNPTEFFKKFNISGATTVGVLMKNVLKKRFTDIELAAYDKNFEKIGTLFKVANLLDYVNSHPADKPEKDYIITKFLQLQPLMNINNSISKIITGEIPADAIIALEKKIPKLNVALIHEEAKNIHIQNTMAKLLLQIYRSKDDYIAESVFVPLKKTKKSDKDKVEDVAIVVAESIIVDAEKKNLSRSDFNRIFLEEINNPTNYTDHNNINPNYIEQLRPLIFGLAADYDKTAFLDSLEEKMVEVFESIKVSEKRMAEELRKGEVVTKTRLENSVIAYADPHILLVFNRKFLNKVYNDENPGFSLTLDSIGKAKVSGSFRSLYDISDILKDKAKLEKQLNVKIETPGHERAAGFIIKSNNPKKYPINEAVIEAVNVFINNSIEKIKENEIENTKDYLLADLDTMKLIDRINKVVRGNVSNFEKITPLLKLTPDTIWTDSYTTEQFTMKQVADTKKYGYITINTDFNNGTIIVPVELIRRIVENDYKDYLSLGYMDAGVFMIDRVVPEKQAKSIIDLRVQNSKTKAIVEAFEQDFKEKNNVELTRENIADNPFFKYHAYGKLNFELFEKMVIGIIDSNKIDTLSVFDVEANGFGNSKLMNFGSTNYEINKDSGIKMKKEDFYSHLFMTSRKEDYLLNDEQAKGLEEINVKDYVSMSISLKKIVLQQYSKEDGVRYFLPPNAEKLTKKKSLPYEKIKNYAENESDGFVYFNREIKATMLAFLVKDKDFRVPQEMIGLTGITQEVLEKYGKVTSQVDKELSDFYTGKKVLFGAHNTPYDARVSRANLPKFYQLMKDNKVYDSALFAKEERLAYDAVSVSNISQIDEINSNVFFYNNSNSDFNLTNFIRENKNGYYPDRTNQYLLEIDNGEYYFVNKVLHEKIKINATKEELLTEMKDQQIPRNTTKYSVEKLSEQWLVHALLLNDENFDIKLVDLSQPKYAALAPFIDEINFFQENYHFDISITKNILNFKTRYMVDVGAVKKGEVSPEMESLALLSQDFLELNKEITQKFSDAWMYKSVLEIKDPSRREISGELIDLVFYQTNIPKEKIVKIFDEAIAFKDKYGIKNVLQHEMHANGPWRTDVKGDVAFEDKLTLCLLANKEYNPYSHDISHALEQFNIFQIKARLIFDIADGLGDSVAQDSYSFRQGILYDRTDTSPMIEKIQAREELLSETGRHVIKFKLDNDVLPPKTAVYAVLKNTVMLTREKIEEHKEKLSFILLNEQLRTSLHNSPERLVQPLQEIYEANETKIIEYKKELADCYDFIEYNKKDHHIQDFLEKAIDIAIFGKTPKTVVKKMVMPTADMESIRNVKVIIDNLVRGASILRTVDQDNVGMVDAMMLDRYLAPNKTRLEHALENPNATIKDFENINEEAFLQDVDIVRKTPLERLLGKHQEFRLLNGIIEENQAYAIEKSLTKKVKP